MEIRHSVIRAAASAVLVALSFTVAMAHAELNRATPAPGGSVPTAPNEVTLNFSEQLEPAFSSVVVHDAGGSRVDKADAHIDKADRTVMRASLQPLAAGTYTVEWRAVTVDAHSTRGTFTFRVGE
jgi:hypothetical protein